MRGLDIFEIFDEPLALQPVDDLGNYMTSRPRSHDPRTDVRGTLEFPLTEQIASNLAAHGEEWTRQYHLARGVPRWELDILIAGARKAAA